MKILLLFQMVYNMILASASNELLNSQQIKKNFDSINFMYAKKDKIKNIVGFGATSASGPKTINTNIEEIQALEFSFNELQPYDDLRNEVNDLIKRLEKIERDLILKLNISNDIANLEKNIFYLLTKIDSISDKETKYSSDLESISKVVNSIQLSLKRFKGEITSEIDILRENLNEAIYKINLNKIELLKQKQANIYYYSRQYGGNGGDSVFRDPIPGNPSMTVRKVFVRYGWYLDCLTLFVGDDATNTFYFTNDHGRTKSSYAVWSVPKGEFITKIEVYVRRDYYASSIILIGGIKFITDKESKSPLYGGSTGELNFVNLPGYLVGVAGRFGASIDAIQFISTMHLNDFKMH